MSFAEKSQEHALQATAILSNLESPFRGLTSLEVANASMYFQMITKDRLKEKGVFLVTSQQPCQVFENEMSSVNKGFNALRVEAVFVPELTNPPSQTYISSWKREFERKVKFLMVEIRFLKAEIFYTDGQVIRIALN